MNMLLLDPQDQYHDHWIITNPRQINHCMQILNAHNGDLIKVGIRNGNKFTAQIQDITKQQLILSPILDQGVTAPPAKLPVTLILALPRPKVLRRIIQDSVSMGVEKIILINSYFVDKSYWLSPILNQLDDAITLGLEQAQDTIVPRIEIEKRFKPFVEDRLATWITADRPAYIAHPYATQCLPTQQTQSCFLMIGCERGFIPYEIELLHRHGAQICHIGQRILRTETSISYCLGRLCA